MPKQTIKIVLLLLFMLQILPAQDSTFIRLDYTAKNFPFGIKAKTPSVIPTISLVLSGGGARGLAQVGVIKALEENNISFGQIVGTSMGSIIGGLYSAGLNLDELTEIGKSSKWNEFSSVNELNRNDLFLDQKITEDKAFLTLRLDGLKPLLPTSLNTGRKISAFLNVLAIHAPLNFNFSDLLFDFNAVCTDIVNGTAVVLNRGSLARAMRASSSVSILMPPVKIDSLLLADGGLVANVPVKIAKSLGGEFIIAVNTTSPLKNREELLLPWNVADQVLSIPMAVINTDNLNYADIVLDPNITNTNGIEFNEVDRIINSGYEETIGKLSDIIQGIKTKTLEKIQDKNFNFKDLKFNRRSNRAETYLAEQIEKTGMFNYKLLVASMAEVYMSGDYKDIYAAIINRGNSSSLIIETEKNPYINRIELSGLNDPEYIEVKTILAELINRPFNPIKTTRALTASLKLFRERNNSLAKITSVRFIENTGLLEIEFNTGIIDEILVEGNFRTNKTVITREFRLKTGEKFDQDIAEKGLVNLQSTNLFEDVELLISRSDNKNVVTIKVTEKITGVARFGIRIDNEYSTQISLDVRDENIFGSGTELGAILTTGLKNRSFEIEHKANRIFDTYLMYKLNAYYNFREIKVYKDDVAASVRELVRNEGARYSQLHTGLSFGIGTQVEKFGNVLMQFRYEHNRIKSKSNFDNNEEAFNLFGWRLAMNIDSQDSYPFPTSGFLVNSYYETAFQLLSAERSYTKFKFDYKGYFALNDIHTFCTKVKLGFADQTLPLSQQFSFGGQSNFFGYREYEYRGRQIFISSLEYRIKLPIQLLVDSYFKLRYDLGSIWSEKEAIRFRDLRHGVGASIAFDTPVGPAEFSVGRSFTVQKGLFVNGVSYGPVFFYFSIGYYY